MPPEISLNTLYDIKNKKDRNKNNTFNEIINKCHNKIKKVAEQGGLTTFYEIPFFIIGKPLYNMEECITYIINAIIKNGFFVRLLQGENIKNNNILYISWNPTDINKRKLIK